jgi:hypothetical protein
MDKKTKIGVLGVTFDLYDKSYPTLKVGREKFLRSLLKNMADEIRR